MDTEDGQLFVKNLAQFVRTHEKALANALQLKKQQAPKHGQSRSISGAVGDVKDSATTNPPSASSALTSSTLAAALSLPYLNFASHNIKPAKLALTPHHLYYLLSRFEDLGINVGPMNVRLESLHSETQSNYVSFLGKAQRPKGGSDRGSIHSVSSMRSVMSGMSSLWSSFGLGGTSSAAKIQKQQAANKEDLKYLYSAFTKIPCLRLTPDRRARLISGYEEFPFDTAVPLIAFKNLSALEISDIDIKQFFGWDRLAEQLRSLTVKRASIDDPIDLIVEIVLDDMNKRRRRSSKAQGSPVVPWAPNASPRRSPTIPHAELVHTNSAPGSPDSRVGSLENRESRGLHTAELARSTSGELVSMAKDRPRSNSPIRPTSSRTQSSHGHIRGGHKIKRSGSNSSHSSTSDTWYNPRGSNTNLQQANLMPSTKWRFLKHLSLADNSLTSISTAGLVPLANTLNSLDLSANLFSQIPDSLASLTALRALNLSNCMIDSLHSLTRNPLPAITALNLRANRLSSLAGIERLYPLERLDLRDNKLTDPTELARLTGIPELKEIWVSGNPFTKTHPNYRITIFNLFRKTPGYTEDIIIDTQGPGYNERRQLVERVPERENVPVVRPAPTLLPAIDLSKPAIIQEPIASRMERPQPAATMSETYTSTSRKRKTAKRRIVDLSNSDSTTVTPKPEPKATTVDQAVSGMGSDSGYGVSPDINSIPTPPLFKSPAKPERTFSEPDKVPRLDPTKTPQLKPTEASMEDPRLPHVETQDWTVSGDIYKKKVEALRNEVGDGWLSVLSEPGWEQKTPAHTKQAHSSPPPAVRPLSSTSRPSTPQSPQSIHSGRTLG